MRWWWYFCDLCETTYSTPRKSGSAGACRRNANGLRSWMCNALAICASYPTRAKEQASTGGQTHRAPPDWLVGGVPRPDGWPTGGHAQLREANGSNLPGLTTPFRQRSISAVAPFAVACASRVGSGTVAPPAGCSERAPAAAAAALPPDLRNSSTCQVPSLFAPLSTLPDTTGVVRARGSPSPRSLR